MLMIAHRHGIKPRLRKIPGCRLQGLKILWIGLKGVDRGIGKVLNHASERLSAVCSDIEANWPWS